MKKSELRQIIREEISKVINDNKKYSREVSLMTSPIVQQGWIDFYNGEINNEKLKSIIKSVCVEFNDLFYEYIEDILSDNNKGLNPSSSGSKVFGFYDFDIQDSTNLSDEEFEKLFNKMERAYNNIVSKTK